MKLRHALLSLAAASAMALPSLADDAPRGKDRRDGQRSEHRGADRDRGGDRHQDARAKQRQRFNEARREIRHKTVERASERDHKRTHGRQDHRGPSAHELLRERREREYRDLRRDRDRRYDHLRHRDRDRRDHDRRRSGVTIDFRIGGGGSYCPPPRSYHRVSRTVVIDGPVVHRPVVRERTVVVERPVVRTNYVAQAWDDLERGRHRQALDSFGILASSHHYDASHKIGYGLAAAQLHDDAVAAIAMRRALRVDAARVLNFLPSPRLEHDLRGLEQRYARRVRLNPYDTDAVFLLAVMRTLQGETITADDLEDDFQMLAAQDRELLGLVAPADGVGMYGP